MLASKDQRIRELEQEIASLRHQASHTAPAPVHAHASEPAHCPDTSKELEALKNKYQKDLSDMIGQFSAAQSESEKALDQISKIEATIEFKDQQISSLTTDIQNNHKFYERRLQIVQSQIAEAQ